jgi:hypothetical protein
MTRRRFALDFLVLMTLAGLAVALNGCSARRSATTDPVSVTEAQQAQAAEITEAAAVPMSTAKAPTNASGRPARATTGKKFGKISASGRYTAPDGSFSVGPPHSATSYEFQNMRYTDGSRTGNGIKLSYVIFGPGPSDPTAYHVVVAEGLGSGGNAGNWAARAREISDTYMRRYDARYGGSSRQVAFEEAVIAEKEGAYLVYRHDPNRPDDAAFYVVFMITVHGDDTVVNVMAEKLTPANPWYPGKEALVRGAWTRFNQFAASVRVTGEE